MRRGAKSGGSRHSEHAPLCAEPTGRTAASEWLLAHRTTERTFIMTVMKFLNRLVGGASLGAVLVAGAMALGGSVAIGTQPAAAAGKLRRLLPGLCPGGSAALPRLCPQQVRGPTQHGVESGLRPALFLVHAQHGQQCVVAAEPSLQGVDRAVRRQWLPQRRQGSGQLNRPSDLTTAADRSAA